MVHKDSFLTLEGCNSRRPGGLNQSLVTLTHNITFVAHFVTVVTLPAT